ncbi:hypothetical protein [Pseudogulbenkiania sp. MAI-1]|uniref:hypothetical protein n=1 Tax=Pseudogulbenkiania sp. MAI-1 TaxID=990370 RepID=UPI0012EBF875|nr:hypothetical protein [Pseudogulbenkiania sp. MAI-1]
MVKAHPQPSKTYNETVCCAGVCMESGAFLRLYPIPYRQLKREQRFNRFDIIEATCWKSEDPRPESHKLDPDSIRVMKQPGSKAKAESSPRLWLPHVSDSLETLRQQNVDESRSLGIIKPDAGSVEFIVSKLSEAKIEEQEAALSVHQQSLLFNDNATAPLPPPEYVFKFRFTSNGKQSEMKLHDWEVQAAYWNFRKMYGESEGLNQLRYKYQEEIPQQNLHLILGTMLAHPRQFITIGLLRSSKLEIVEAQGALF